MMRLLAALLAALALSGAPVVAQPANPVQGNIVNLGTVDASAVITTGNTFQTVLSALAASSTTGVVPVRRSLTIENNNATDSCWVYPHSGTATKAKSILLLPGGSYTRYWPYVPSDAIQATCASDSDSLYVETN